MGHQTSANILGEQSRADAALMVDLRAPADFARGHPRGAVSLPFSAKGLGRRLAVIVEPGAAIRLLASDPAVSSAALAQLQDAYDVVDVLNDSGWGDDGLPKESLRDLSVRAVAEAAASADLTILDVREPVEWETGFAPGAVLISLGSLVEQLEAISRDTVVAVICEGGVRSSTGASLLQAAGFPRVATVSEGMSGYRRAGLPVEFPDSHQPG